MVRGMDTVVSSGPMRRGSMPFHGEALSAALSRVLAASGDESECVGRGTTSGKDRVSGETNGRGGGEARRCAELHTRWRKTRIRGAVGAASHQEQHCISSNGAALHQLRRSSIATAPTEQHYIRGAARSQQRPLLQAARATGGAGARLPGLGGVSSPGSERLEKRTNSQPRGDTRVLGPGAQGGCGSAGGAAPGCGAPARAGCSGVQLAPSALNVRWGGDAGRGT